METLYRLKYHVIGVDKEEGRVSFLKEANNEELIIDSKKLGFVIKDSSKIYNDLNMKIDEIRYEKHGNAIEIDYSDNEKTIKIREVFRYITDIIIEHYFIILEKFCEDTGSFELNISDIKSLGNMELIVPGAYFAKKIGLGEKYSFENTEEDLALTVLKNKKINFINFYYGNDRSKVIIEKKNKDSYEIIYEFEEIELRKDKVIGGHYIILSRENYLENLEEIKYFYEKNPESNSNIEVVKGLKSIKGKEIFVDFNLAELLGKYIVKDINLEEFMTLLKCDYALKNSLYFTRVFSPKGREGFSKKEYAIYILLGAILEFSILKKDELIYLKELNILKNNYPELEKGKKFFNHLLSRKVFSMIKRFEESASIIAINSFDFEIEDCIYFEYRYFPEKQEIYILKNLLNGKTEALLYNNSVNLCFEAYEYKIMKLLPFTGENLIGYEKEYILEDEIIFKNNFFILKFNRGITVYSRYLGKNVLTFNLKTEDIKLENEKIVILFESYKIELDCGLTNRINIYFKGSFSEKIKIKKHSMNMKAVKNEKRKKLYTGESYIKIEIIKGLMDILDNVREIELQNIENGTELIMDLI